MAKFKHQVACMIALMASPFSTVNAQEQVENTEPKTAGSEEAAQQGAKGSLSAGAMQQP